MACPGLANFSLKWMTRSSVLAVELVDVVGRVAGAAHLFHPVALGLGRVVDGGPPLLGIRFGDDRMIPVGVHHEAHRRTVRPRNALAGIVGDLHAVPEIRAHVARGARGRGAVVLPHDPGLRVEVHLGDEVAERHAMLRLVVDLLLRMVRAEVALAAVLGLPGAARREVVAAMAGGARPGRAVHVQPADAGVGPARAAQQGLAALVAHDAAHGLDVGRLPVLVRLQVAHRDEAAVGRLEGHERAVTLLAARVGRRKAVHHLYGLAGRRRMRIERHPRPLDRLRQEIVERSQDVAGLRVVAGRELRRLGRMAARAVARRHDRRDLLPVVREDVGVLRLGLVTIDTGDALLGVRGTGPVLDDALGRLRVAVDALSGSRRRGNRRARPACPVLAPGHLEPLHRHEGEEEEEAQARDDPAFLIECHGNNLSARRALPTS